jgi:hypothetical protein
MLFSFTAASSNARLVGGSISLKTRTPRFASLQWTHNRRDALRSSEVSMACTHLSSIVATNWQRTLATDSFLIPLALILTKLPVNFWRFYPIIPFGRYCSAFARNMLSETIRQMRRLNILPSRQIRDIVLCIFRANFKIR